MARNAGGSTDRHKIVAAEVPAGVDQLAGVALLAGAATNGKDVLRWQAQQVAPTLPKPIKLLMKLLRQDLVRTQTKRLDRIESSTDDVIRVQFVRLNAKWFREFMSFEPVAALGQAAVPVLAITGTKDLQVNPVDVALKELLQRDDTEQYHITAFDKPDIPDTSARWKSRQRSDQMQPGTGYGDGPAPRTSRTG